MLAPIPEELLAILRCPATQSVLHLATPEQLEILNSMIEDGSLVDRSGTAVKRRLESGLVNESNQLLYPVQNNIPTLLADEAIELPE